MTKEIIVAAYDKPLDWISNINKDVKITIYRKGNILNSSFDEIKIEPRTFQVIPIFNPNFIIK
jgi:predicted metal-dependent RNase